MKIILSLVVITSILFVPTVFVENVIAGEYALKPELESMIKALESCRSKYMNAEWKQARFSVMGLKKKFAESVPKLSLAGDKTSISNLGIFITKLESSIHDKDRASSQRNTVVIENIIQSFMATSQAH